MHETLSIAQTTKGKLPRLPFLRIKNALLGPSYRLSLVLAGDRRTRTLNRRFRRKSYVPNVLSFPLSRGEGEIFLNPRQAAREAERFSMSERTYLAYLFIHGCLHLKGLPHGGRMERIERQTLRRFKLT